MKKLLFVLTLTVLFAGCMQTAYCPIENKRVGITETDSTCSDQTFQCPTDPTKTCIRCLTSYSDINGHTWMTVETKVK